jgi:ATP-dependent RNA helicase DDX49/DBP8
MSTLFGKSKRKRDRLAASQPAVATTRAVDKETTDSTEISDSTTAKNDTQELQLWSTFDDLGLAEPLVTTCRQLGFKRPTPVQRVMIPYLLRNPRSHVLALASTGSGKTAAFCLPILHRLAPDPYGIFAVILTPTRELAKQIHQQVLALGSAYNVTSSLVVGGLDSLAQALELDRRPHVCVATPGRLAELLRGPKPPALFRVRFLVLVGLSATWLKCSCIVGRRRQTTRLVRPSCLVQP